MIRGPNVRRGKEPKPPQSDNHHQKTEHSQQTTAWHSEVRTASLGQSGKDERAEEGGGESWGCAPSKQTPQKHTI
jgi:hypothetical protein